MKAFIGILKFNSPYYKAETTEEAIRLFMETVKVDGEMMSRVQFSVKEVGYFSDDGKSIIVETKKRNAKTV